MAKKQVSAAKRKKAELKVPKKLYKALRKEARQESIGWTPQARGQLVVASNRELACARSQTKLFNISSPRGTIAGQNS
jgi:hypothetical protein